MLTQLTLSYKSILSMQKLDKYMPIAAKLYSDHNRYYLLNKKNTFAHYASTEICSTDFYAVSCLLVDILSIRCSIHQVIWAICPLGDFLASYLLGVCPWGFVRSRYAPICFINPSTKQIETDSFNFCGHVMHNNFACNFLNKYRCDIA